MAFLCLRAGIVVEMHTVWSPQAVANSSTVAPWFWRSHQWLGHVFVGFSTWSVRHIGQILGSLGHRWSLTEVCAPTVSWHHLETSRNTWDLDVAAKSSMHLCPANPGDMHINKSHIIYDSHMDNIYMYYMCVYVYTYETYQFVNDSDWDAFTRKSELCAQSSRFNILQLVHQRLKRAPIDRSMAPMVQRIKTSLQMRLERSLNGQDLGGSWGDLWSMNEYEYYCYITAILLLYMNNLWIIYE